MKNVDAFDLMEAMAKAGWCVTLKRFSRDNGRWLASANWAGNDLLKHPPQNEFSDSPHNALRVVYERLGRPGGLVLC